MEKLHANQEKLLKLLINNKDAPLTIHEIKEALGMSSTSVVCHHIKQLENKGYLRRNPSNPRDYQILSEKPDKEITYVNLYGLAHCGPSGLITDGVPIDRIPIATKLLGFSSADAFLVKAKGDSMEPEIKSNDIIIASKVLDTLKNGDRVVCSYHDSPMIKVFTKLNNESIVLLSLNTKYSPILVDIQDLNIEGIVKGVLNYMR